MAAIARIEILRGVRGRHLAAPDRGQHAHDPAHHLPEKVRALHADEDQRAGLDELEALEDDDGGFLVGIVVGEGGEVLTADERLGRASHRAEIERLADPPDERLGERRPAAGDLVEVAARDGIVPRVEAVRRLVDREDVDVGRQLVVEAAPERLGRQVV